MRHAWVSRAGMVALVGGLCLVGSGLGIKPAAAAPPVKEDALAGVTQNWDKHLPSASRFTVLSAFGGAAVRDNNTGLVWEQAPDLNPPVVLSVPSQGWGGATYYCINKTVGGTVGWRLPSVVELKSLQDPSLSNATGFVPPTVFTGITNADVFWSATAYASDPTLVWVVSFGSISDVARSAKSQTWRAWCVRGPMNADTY